MKTDTRLRWLHWSAHHVHVTHDLNLVESGHRHTEIVDQSPDAIRSLFVQVATGETVDAGELLRVMKTHWPEAFPMANAELMTKAAPQVGQGSNRLAGYDQGAGR